MPEQKKGADKKLWLVPLLFDEALKGLLETEPPNEKQEKKTSTKHCKHRTSKKTDGDD
jgi:hypothetical protein